MPRASLRSSVCSLSMDLRTRTRLVRILLLTLIVAYLFTACRQLDNPATPAKKRASSQRPDLRIFHFFLDKTWVYLAGLFPDPYETLFSCVEEQLTQRLDSLSVESEGGLMVACLYAGILVDAQRKTKKFYPALIRAILKI